MAEKLWNVGEANFVPEVRSQMNLPRKVIVFDETLREGEETPGMNMSTDLKVEIARVLEEMGVREVNMGYMGYIEEHAAAAKAVKKACPKLILTGYIRAHGTADIEKLLDVAKESGIDKVDINIPSSDYQFKIKGLSKGLIMDVTPEAIYKAKQYGFEVTYGPYDTTRTELNYLKALLKIAEQAGASRVRVYDTLGVLNPAATRWWVSELVKTISIPIQYHTHDDFGMGTANTCAAVEGGASAIDLVVNGLGDRAGNTSFEETVLALEALYNVDTGIDLSQLIRLSKLVETAGIKVPRNKPVVGENCFIHEADMHVQGILSGNWQTFEPYHPSVVGQARQVYFGSTTSRSSIDMLARSINVAISEAKIEDALREVLQIVSDRVYATQQEVEDLIRKYAQ
ncbi:MAG: hypothetical protein LBK56_12860 [Gracilibacteraceae bacterium]|nr:hypothetical protein [Gracilibacteraceae bacterium]